MAETEWLKGLPKTERRKARLWLALRRKAVEMRFSGAMDRAIARHMVAEINRKVERLAEEGAS